MNRFTLAAIAVAMMSAAETEVSAGAVTATPTVDKAEKAAAVKAVKEAKAAERAAAKVAKEAEKAAALAAKPKVERLRSNGQTRPAAGTTTGRVWEIADLLSAQLQRPAERAEVLAFAREENAAVNESTVATQYGRWCLFYNVKKARVVAVAPATEAVGKEELVEEVV